MESEKDRKVFSSLVAVIGLLAGLLGNTVGTKVNDPRPDPYTGEDGKAEAAARQAGDEREAAIRKEAIKDLWAYIHTLETRCDAKDRQIYSLQRDMQEHKAHGH